MRNFKKGDRVVNGHGQIATVTTVLTNGDTLGVEFDGSQHTVYRPAELFNKIAKSKAAPAIAGDGGGSKSP